MEKDKEILEKALNVITEAKEVLQELKKGLLPQPAPVSKKDPVKVMEQVAKMDGVGMTGAANVTMPPAAPLPKPAPFTSSLAMNEDSSIETEMIKFAPNGQWSLEKKDMAKEEGEKGQKKVAKVMREFKHGTLHHGSKEGPVVKDRKVAQAIAMQQSGLSNKK